MWYRSSLVTHWVRIWHFYCYGSGNCCSTGLIPGQGTFACHGFGHKSCDTNVRGYIGVLLWCSRLWIQHCHCSSLDCCCGANSIPGLRTFTWGQKTKTKISVEMFLKGPSKYSYTCFHKKTSIWTPANGDQRNCINSEWATTVPVK